MVGKWEIKKAVSNAEDVPPDVPIADKAAKRLLCNCSYWRQFAAADRLAVSFICPVHGCATLDPRPIPAKIEPSHYVVPAVTTYTDARSTKSIEARPIVRPHPAGSAKK